MPTEPTSLAVPTKYAQAAWKQTSPGDRREVLRLAKHSEQHPDPAVAAAAYAWSHRTSLNTWANTRPGWLLPAAGALLLIVALAVQLPAFFVVGAIAVIISGLLGWNSTASARLMRRVYSTAPLHND